MYLFEGNIVPMANGKFHCFILKVSHDPEAPNHDTVKEYDAETLEEAQIWLDDEICRLYTGKGLWDATA